MSWRAPKRNVRLVPAGGNSVQSPSRNRSRDGKNRTASFGRTKRLEDTNDRGFPSAVEGRNKRLKKTNDRADVREGTRPRMPGWPGRVRSTGRVAQRQDRK